MKKYLRNYMLLAALCAVPSTGLFAEEWNGCMDIIAVDDSPVSGHVLECHFDQFSKTPVRIATWQGTSFGAGPGSGEKVGQLLSRYIQDIGNFQVRYTGSIVGDAVDSSHDLSKVFMPNHYFTLTNLETPSTRVEITTRDIEATEISCFSEFLKAQIKVTQKNDL